jgi:predicted MFS family arabinose efflux permease
MTGPLKMANDEEHLDRYTWYVILLLAAVNFFNYMDRMALAVLLPYVKAELHLADSQLGLLTGLAFSLFYAVCGIPIAWFADRSVRRDIVAAALATWSVMTALGGAAQNFLQLFLTRVGVGAGEAGCLAPAQSMLCDYVALRRRAGVFALQGVGSILGMSIGMALAGWLGATIGWRWTLVALGLPGIALAVVVKLTLREPVRGIRDSVKDSGAPRPFRQTFASLWACPTYRWISFHYALNGFVTYGLNQWWPSYYARQFNLSMTAIGAYLGVAIGVGAGAGLIVGGVLANRTMRRDVRLPLFVGAGAVLVALPLAIGSLFASSVATSAIFVALTTFLWSIPNGTTTAVATSVVPANVRATAGAINIFCAAVFGFGLGPLAVGLISDSLAPSLGTEALRYALIAPACLLSVMALILTRAAGTVATDLRAAGALPPGDTNQRDRSIAPGSRGARTYS